ncbi:MAG: TetR family transcriptional regulator [Ilumatobacteraceae bacterium]
MARRTQQERTEHSRRRLVKAALALMGTQGYAGTTLAEIGRAAGVSRGLVTYHFGTKEACIRAVLEDVRRGTARANAAAGERTRGLAALDRVTEGYLRGYVTGHPGGRAIFVAITESISATPELRELTTENDEAFRGVVQCQLQEAVDDGELAAGVDVGVLSVLVVGLLRGVALQWLVQEAAVDLDRVVPAVQRMVHASLACEAAAPSARTPRRQPRARRQPSA